MIGIHAIRAGAAALAAGLLTLTAAASGQASRNWLTVVAQTEGGHRIGNPDAPLKLTEYVSYTCPHCAAFAREGSPALDLGYVSPGKVSVEVRHLLRDPVDMTVALLTNCGPVAKFPKNHTTFMSGQDSWIGPMRTATAAQRQRWTTGPYPARFKAIAADFKFYDIMERLGYTRSEVDRCLNDEAKAKQLSEASEADWKLPGVSGTPSFAIDGNVLAGTAGWRLLEPQIAARL